MVNNNFPNLEKRYENADELMRLEMNMIYAIEKRIIERSKHYKRGMFKLKEVGYPA